MDFTDKIKDNSASVVVEFALILPIILTLFFGVFEVSSYIYAAQKNQSSAIMTANLIGSLTALDERDINNIIDNAIKTILNILVA